MEYGRIKSGMKFKNCSYVSSLNSSALCGATALTFETVLMLQGSNKDNEYLYFGNYGYVRLFIKGFNYIMFNYWDESNTQNIFNFTYTIKFYEPYHIVHVIDGDTIYVYVNGELIGETTGSGNIICNNIPLYLASPYTYCYNGIIYLHTIYKRKLTNSEIVRHYNAWQYGENMRKFIDSSTVLWLDGDSIDEDAGLWRDMSGKGNDGTIYGAKKVSNVGVIEE